VFGKKNLGGDLVRKIFNDGNKYSLPWDKFPLSANQARSLYNNITIDSEYVMNQIVCSIINNIQESHTIFTYDNTRVTDKVENKTILLLVNAGYHVASIKNGEKTTLYISWDNEEKWEQFNDQGNNISKIYA